MCFLSTSVAGKFSSSWKLRKAGRPGDQVRDRALYEHVDVIENNLYESLTVSDCIRLTEAHLQENNSEAYGPTHMRRKLKECFSGYIKFCQYEQKSHVVRLKTSASKLLHEVHLESENKDKNERK